MAAKAPEEAAKGNASIYVALRIRPFVPREQLAHETRVLNCSNGQLQLQNPHGGQVSGFTGFDEVMDSSVDSSDPYYADQKLVYEKVGTRILNQVLDGYSTALFAYGQTGSGKTTSIMGDVEDDEQLGILPRLLRALFEETKSDSSRVVKCSVLEVYNERLRDLLIPRGDGSKEPAKLDIRCHPELGNYVPGLTQELIGGVKDATRCIDFARLNQTVAATQMNAKSSRAHTLFNFIMERNAGAKAAPVTKITTTWFVDLAGRENEKTTLARGERLVELGFINKSLFHLSNCIQALGQASKGSANYPKIKGYQAFEGKVNFRNSKITLLLQEALSGNSRTFMLGTLSPATSAFDENAVTLRFAATVKNIKTQATKKQDKGEVAVAALQEEVERLRARLVEAQKNNSEIRVTEDLSCLHESLEAAEEALQQKTKSVEELKLQTDRLKKRQVAMMLRLGVAKDRANRLAQRNNRLPFVSSEHADASRCGALEYSLAHLDCWYFGDSRAACEAEARKQDELATFDAAHEHLSFVSEKCTNCVELRGFGMAPLTARLSKKHVPHPSKSPAAARPSSSSAIPEERSLATVGNADLHVKPEEPVGSKELRIMRLHEKACVMVNNVSLRVNEESAPLRHGDKIVLGKSFVFRVYIDNAEIVGDEEMTHTPRNRRTMYQTPDEMKTVLAQLLGPEDFADTFMQHQAKQFLSALRNVSIDHESKVRKYLYEAVKLRALVEEAQEITDKMRAQDGLRIELAHCGPIVSFGYAEAFLPVPLVRVARNVSDAAWKRWRKQSSAHVKANSEHISENLHAPLDFDHHHHEEQLDAIDETLFVWTTSKFLARLDMMRDIYHAWQEGHEVVVDLKNDPWVEAGPVEIEFWLDKHTAQLHHQIEDLRAQATEVKQGEEKSKSRVEAMESERDKALAEVKEKDAQIARMQSVFDKETKEKAETSSSTESSLRVELARLSVLVEQKDRELETQRQQQSEAALQSAKQASVERANFEAALRKAREEHTQEVSDTHEQLSDKFETERARTETAHEVEKTSLLQQVEELKQQVAVAQQRNDTELQLEHERLAQLQNEMKAERAALAEQTRREMAQLRKVMDEKEARLDAEKAALEGERDKLLAEKDQALSSMESRHADRLATREAELQERTKRMETLAASERELLSEKLKRVERERDSALGDANRAAAERDAAVAEKTHCEELLQQGQDGSAAQLKRCMELSLANQKLLDQFFTKNSGDKSGKQKEQLMSQLSKAMSNTNNGGRPQSKGSKSSVPSTGKP
ncbi:unnamed protein product [Amoebophrya sp. A25]|nr:unnamed protein product [Amoebophrya sp. A25]|eukprot:GSA25T00016074001.1